ncbi:MAG TPA: dihydrodipicolinate synthase family protein [Ramlibacter sp.]|uniref:dihydrodipicolinate synthase family protein n=1 Tax=Ramlibacter sp. TaxID=1917967 RepID=UPI002CE947D9|nr:dihydrodipicolinate synthase family protein [Ramlibacter sp.]HVZ46529.1 dihydrodipicolinate synthase family protein [Ramlibacter sp.]
MLSAKDIRGAYAIMPTPALPGAERLDARATVNLQETERLVNCLIDDGCDGLIALGTTGECPTLSQDDYESFAACVVETARRRVPTFIGTTAASGHEVWRRMAFIRKLGAEGTLLGMPHWQPMTADAAVRYLAELSGGFPEVAIMVYANQRAFRFTFPDEFWEAVVRSAPTVTSAKYAMPRDLRKLVQITQGRVNIIPNEMTIPKFVAESPETTIACWATAASMGPQPVVALMRALASGDSARAKELDAAIAWANQPIEPIVFNPEVFALCNIQLEKTRIEAAGYCNPGPVRPPYGPMTDAQTAASVECGRRWSRLCGHLRAGTPLASLY